MNVEHAAAEALGKMGDPRAVEPLIDALSTDMWLQFPAAIALGDIGDSGAVDQMISLLVMPGV
jgi:HEAT repeat protein